jgi:hypothetical protein
MKKLSLLFCLVVVLTGCGPGYKPGNFPIVPSELKDCTFWYLRDVNGSSLTVVRCPLSTTSTTYRVGKTSATTIVTE